MLDDTTDVRPFTLRLDPLVHREVRISAAHAEMSMQEWIHATLVEACGLAGAMRQRALSERDASTRDRAGTPDSSGHAQAAPRPSGSRSESRPRKCKHGKDLSREICKLCP